MWIDFDVVGTEFSFKTIHGYKQISERSEEFEDRIYIIINCKVS